MKRLKNFHLAQPGWLIPFLVLVVAFMAPNTDMNAADPGETTGKIMRTPEISVSRSVLNFGSVREGDHTSSLTSPQDFRIWNSGGGTLEWTILDDAEWLNVSPSNGTNSGVVTVSVGPCGLSAGSYTGTIKISAHGASNSPQQVTVNLNVYDPSGDLPPFGDFATPIHDSTVRSSIPVTGWALDDVKVENVKIYNGSSYVGDAVFVEGARPDLEQAFPDYPNNYTAGWGYMLLTNFLPNGGNGTYTLHAIATDSEGQQTTLGSKTIHCDNANAVKPFGAIDTPTQGGTASGNAYINWGWALTPQPKHIPTDGSTIHVFVDGVNKGHVNQYNIYRDDINTLFPDYANSDGAVGFFYMDTTGYADGVHTIYWTATDNEGRTDGIGSRYFSINNTNGEKTAHAASQTQKRLPLRIGHLNDFTIDDSTPVRMRKGFREDIEPREIYPDHEALTRIEIKECERIELDFSNGSRNISEISGYMLMGDQIRPLPIGSTLDSKTGKFYWLAGPAFLGEYRFVFTFIEKGSETKKQKHLILNIVPMYQ